MLLPCLEVTEFEQGETAFRENMSSVGRSVCQQSLCLKSFNHPLIQRGFSAFFLLSLRVNHRQKPLNLPKSIKLPVMPSEMDKFTNESGNI